jgi:hypothetical protein
MTKKVKLSPSMTEVEFDNGYWYTVELKHFAEEIGVPSVSNLRKDELEKSIKHFLRTGQIKSLPQKSLPKTGVKDVEKGLSLQLPIVIYRSNKETKDFIIKEAQKIEPNLKEKSGVRYRLNRWREEQLAQGKKITYEDLVKQYVKLNRSEGSFSRIAHGRYINFVADFMAGKKQATRAEAVKAWEELKKLDTPKTYEAWKKHQK